jgi:hypothetical protein
MMMKNTAKRSTGFMWFLPLLFIAAGMGIATAQTCNPNAESSFTSWTNGGPTITDNTTGLIWQRCAIGQSWTGSSCSGAATTQAWSAAVSGALPGWRLPNVKELESMVERRCATPAVDIGAFPQAPAVSFWSSTPGWAVNFTDGSVLSGQGATTLMAVRYVQGGDAATLNNFDAGAGAAINCNPNVPFDRATSQWTVNADGTLTDQITRLTWRRCAEGMTYAAGRCSTGPTFNTYGWSQALDVPSLPGNAGWRVPNVKELESFVDRSCASPAVSGARFPDQPAVDFWSSTPGWAVSLNDGSVLSGQTLSAAKAVRLVKDGATTNAFTTGSGGAGNCTTQARSDFKLIEWQENADSTLYDSGTGMTWDRCALGQTWSAAQSTCTGTPSALTWAVALQRADGRFVNGRTGWRVPNVKELESIVDRSCSNPALNPDLFRGNRETLTWSSTPGWAVNMIDGSVLSGQAVATTMAVRLVRGGNNTAAYSAGVPGVPGSVVAGPSDVAADDIVNSALLLPTTANQKLMLLTHGWRSDADEWPATMLGVVCARLGATVSTLAGAPLSRVGVTGYCDTPAWRVVAFNWKPVAAVASPWTALSRAGPLGEKVGKVLTDNAVKYDLVHLIAHSAGANLVHELGHQLRRIDAVNPKIHSTFLDAFCGHPDRCDYGYWSDWADSYFDANQVIVSEGTETRRQLCNAANFEVTATYPNADAGRFDDWISAARHAWPYKCYVNSASQGGPIDDAFNVGCMGNLPGSIGFGLSYLGSGAGSAAAYFSARNANNPIGQLRKQNSIGVFGSPQSSSCTGVSGLSRAANAVGTTVGNATSAILNTIAPGVLSPTSTCAAPQYVQPNTAGSTPMMMRTCAAPVSALKAPQSLSVSPATAELAPSWSAIAVSTGRRANQLRFTMQFTEPANGLLTVYVDEQEVYRTTRATRGAAVYDTGFIDMPAISRGAHTVSFRLDALDVVAAAEAAVVVSDVQVGAAALCDLDVDGDGAMTVARDGALLLRYLMGFRGAALTANLGITDVNAAQAIADYVGSALQFDVFGRSNVAPQATTDGLVLLRLMLGMPDAALLNGIALPLGALFTTGGDLRTNVNGKCGTRF